MRSPLAAVALAGAAALLLAGCGSNGSAPATTPAAAPPASSTGTPGGGGGNDTAGGGMPAPLRFVRCLRAHGLDVELGTDGAPHPAQGTVLETSQGPTSGSGPGGGVARSGGAQAGGGPSGGGPTASLDPKRVAAAEAECTRTVPDYVAPTTAGS